MNSLILLPTVIVSISFPALNGIIVDDYRKIFTLQKNITELYKTAGGYNRGHELITTICKYIDEMEDLQIGMQNEESEAVDVLKEIYIAGGPQHVQSPPLERLTKSYNWKENDIAEFKSALNVTDYLWRDITKVIEKTATDGMDITPF